VSAPASPHTATARRAIILIPAYQPPPSLLVLLRDLQARDGGRLVSRYLIVNDGSGVEFEATFAEAAGMPNVTLLRHARNQGKGAALKTAFAHILEHHPGAAGVVTADADGQHVAEDVLRVAEALIARPDHLVLGTRVFDPGVPLRSVFGNQLTRLVFGLFTGKRLRDTQTGLRGWPLALCRRGLEIPLTGFDYELEALIIGVRHCPIFEVPIRTIYVGRNETSHFKPIGDSIRIYKVFLRRGKSPG
jgi:glycosyltransferase involved in cell wall biosynthesis